MDDRKQKKHFSSKIQKVCSLPILAQNIPNLAQVFPSTSCLIFCWLRTYPLLKGSVYSVYSQTSFLSFWSASKSSNSIKLFTLLWNSRYAKKATLAWAKPCEFVIRGSIQFWPLFSRLRMKNRRFSKQISGHLCHLTCNQGKDPGLSRYFKRSNVIHHN